MGEKYCGLLGGDVGVGYWLSKAVSALLTEQAVGKHLLLADPLAAHRTPSTCLSLL
eukprot:m.57466 g.57466  ORF g.57466 m.57466 type:complete len:56 (+) comp13085_c2_seq2:353-520(+)